MAPSVEGSEGVREGGTGGIPWRGRAVSGFKIQTWDATQEAAAAEPAVSVAKVRKQPGLKLHLFPADPKRYVRNAGDI